jgi:hypothetical protein
MSVRILVGASHAYACIEHPGYSLDVQLRPGRSAAQSLREEAVSVREQAATLLRRAHRMEIAAQELEETGDV